MEKNIMVLAFIVFMLIAIFIYTDMFGIFYDKEIHPLITELQNRFNKPTKHIEKQIIWTYLEEPDFLDKDINVQLLHKNKNFPITSNIQCYLALPQHLLISLKILKTEEMNLRNSFLK